VTIDLADPPSPRVLVRRFAAGAAALALAAFAYQWLSTGRGDWKLIAFAGLVLTLTDIFASFLGMAGSVLTRFFQGSTITLEDEIADLEQRLADPALPAEHEIPMALRLAEIYRKYRHDSHRAAGLVARIRAKYPNAPELHGVDRLS